jgi:transposase
MTLLRLRPWERRHLVALVRSPRDARQLRRAQALLWLQDGQPVRRVAELLQVQPRTIYNWARAFRQRAEAPPAERLLDAPRSGRPPTASGVIEPLIDAVIDRDPRDFGYRATTWTAPLLRRYLREGHQVATSRKSVSRALDRLGFRWKRPRHRLGLRPGTWRRAKGGSRPGEEAGRARPC